jgi:hypothetical protein
MAKRFGAPAVATTRRVVNRLPAVAASCRRTRLERGLPGSAFFLGSAVGGVAFRALSAGTTQSFGIGPGARLSLLLAVSRRRAWSAYRQRIPGKRPAVCAWRATAIFDPKTPAVVILRLGRNFRALRGSVRRYRVRRFVPSYRICPDGGSTKATGAGACGAAVR